MYFFIVDKKRRKFWDIKCKQLYLQTVNLSYAFEDESKQIIF
jgi:hypothetical protein